MAEANKSGILAKAQKRLSRTKTKVLQTLGKADKSTDETFDDLVLKTEKQHDVAHHLQKEFKSYLHCMRALGTANKCLGTALSETYEEGWTDEEGFKKSLANQDLLWNDYLDSVQSSVMEQLNTYITSFPALKAKISKRGRKMVDYDNSRHNLEVLQAAKKKDEAKIAKAQEDLNESKRIFEDLHNELCAELPDFYNSRVTFYADLFEKLFGCENTLHTEIARTSQSLTDSSQRLAREHIQFVYTPKRPLSKSHSEKKRLARFKAILRTENSTFYSGSDEHPPQQHMNGESSLPGGPDSLASTPTDTPTTPSAMVRPLSTPAAGGDDGAAAASDDDDDEHLYGNQDSVVAAANINGDADKKEPQEDQDASAAEDGYMNAPASPYYADDSEIGDDYATVSQGNSRRPNSPNPTLVAPLGSCHATTLTAQPPALPVMPSHPVMTSTQSLSPHCPSIPVPAFHPRAATENSFMPDVLEGTKDCCVTSGYQHGEAVVQPETNVANSVNMSRGSSSVNSLEGVPLRGLGETLAQDGGSVTAAEDQDQGSQAPRLSDKARAPAWEPGRGTDPLSPQQQATQVFIHDSFQQEMDQALMETLGTGRPECCTGDRMSCWPLTPLCRSLNEEESMLLIGGTLMAGETNLQELRESRELCCAGSELSCSPPTPLCRSLNEEESMLLVGGTLMAGETNLQVLRKSQEICCAGNKLFCSPPTPLCRSLNEEESMLLVGETLMAQETSRPGWRGSHRAPTIITEPSDLPTTPAGSPASPLCVSINEEDLEDSMLFVGERSLAPEGSHTALEGDFAPDGQGLIDALTETQHGSQLSVISELGAVKDSYEVSEFELSLKEAATDLRPVLALPDLNGNDAEGQEKTPPAKESSLQPPSTLLDFEKDMLQVARSVHRDKQDTAATDAKTADDFVVSQREGGHKGQTTDRVDKGFGCVTSPSLGLTGAHSWCCMDDRGAADQDDSGAADPLLSRTSSDTQEDSSSFSDFSSSRLSQRASLNSCRSPAPGQEEDIVTALERAMREGPALHDGAGQSHASGPVRPRETAAQAEAKDVCQSAVSVERRQVSGQENPSKASSCNLGVIPETKVPESRLDAGVFECSLESDQDGVTETERQLQVDGGHRGVPAQWNSLTDKTASSQVVDGNSTGQTKVKDSRIPQGTKTTETEQESLSTDTEETQSTDTEEDTKSTDLEQETKSTDTEQETEGTEMEQGASMAETEQGTKMVSLGVLPTGFFDWSEGSNSHSHGCLGGSTDGQFSRAECLEPPEALTIREVDVTGNHSEPEKPSPEIARKRDVKNGSLGRLEKEVHQTLHEKFRAPRTQSEDGRSPRKPGGKSSGGRKNDSSSPGGGEAGCTPNAKARTLGGGKTKSDDSGGKSGRRGWSLGRASREARTPSKEGVAQSGGEKGSPGNPGREDTGTSSSAEKGSHSSKKSLTRRGMQMFRSILHMGSSKGKPGEKSSPIQADKSLTLHRQPPPQVPSRPARSGNSVGLPGNSLGLPGNSVDLPGNGVDLPGPQGGASDVESRSLRQDEFTYVKHLPAQPCSPNVSSLLPRREYFADSRSSKTGGPSAKPRARSGSSSEGQSCHDGDDAKGAKRKSSPSSHTHSPTPGNRKKEKKSDSLSKAQASHDQTFQDKSEKKRNKKGKSHSSPSETRKKNETVGGTRDTTEDRQSETISTAQSNTKKDKPHLAPHIKDGEERNAENEKSVVIASTDGGANKEETHSALITKDNGSPSFEEEMSDLISAKQGDTNKEGSPSKSETKDSPSKKKRKSGSSPELSPLASASTKAATDRSGEGPRSGAKGREIPQSGGEAGDVTGRTHSGSEPHASDPELKETGPLSEKGWMPGSAAGGGGGGGGGGTQASMDQAGVTIQQTTFPAELFSNMSSPPADPNGGKAPTTTALPDVLNGTVTQASSHSAAPSSAQSRARSNVLAQTESDLSKAALAVTVEDSSVKPTDGGKASSLLEARQSRLAGGGQSKPAGKGLNPLAAPFTMPSTPLTTRPSSVPPFTAPPPHTLPGPMAGAQLAPGLQTSGPVVAAPRSASTDSGFELSKLMVPGSEWGLPGLWMTGSGWEPSPSFGEPRIASSYMPGEINSACGDPEQNCLSASDARHGVGTTGRNFSPSSPAWSGGALITGPIYTGTGLARRGEGKEEDFNPIYSQTTDNASAVMSRISAVSAAVRSGRRAHSGHSPSDAQDGHLTSPASGFPSRTAAMPAPPSGFLQAPYANLHGERVEESRFQLCADVGAQSGDVAIATQPLLMGPEPGSLINKGMENCGVTPSACSESEKGSEIGNGDVVKRTSPCAAAEVKEQVVVVKSRADEETHSSVKLPSPGSEAEEAVLAEKSNPAESDGFLKAPQGTSDKKSAKAVAWSKPSAFSSTPFKAPWSKPSAFSSTPSKAHPSGADPAREAWRKAWGSSSSTNKAGKDGPQKSPPDRNAGLPENRTDTTTIINLADSSERQDEGADDDSSEKAVSEKTAGLLEVEGTDRTEKIVSEKVAGLPEDKGVADDCTERVVAEKMACLPEVKGADDDSSEKAISVKAVECEQLAECQTVTEKPVSEKLQAGDGKVEGKNGSQKEGGLESGTERHVASYQLSDGFEDSTDGDVRSRSDSSEKAISENAAVNRQSAECQTVAEKPQSEKLQAGDGQVEGKNGSQKEGGVETDTAETAASKGGARQEVCRSPCGDGEGKYGFEASTEGDVRSYQVSDGFEDSMERYVRRFRLSDGFEASTEGYVKSYQISDGFETSVGYVRSYQVSDGFETSVGFVGSYQVSDGFEASTEGDVRSCQDSDGFEVSTEDITTSFEISDCFETSTEDVRSYQVSDGLEVSTEGGNLDDPSIFSNISPDVETMAQVRDDCSEGRSPSFTLLPREEKREDEQTRCKTEQNTNIMQDAPKRDENAQEASQTVVEQEDSQIGEIQEASQTIEKQEASQTGEEQEASQTIGKQEGTGEEKEASQTGEEKEASQTGQEKESSETGEDKEASQTREEQKGTREEKESSETGEEKEASRTGKEQEDTRECTSEANLVPDSIALDATACDSAISTHSVADSDQHRPESVTACDSAISTRSVTDSDQHRPESVTACDSAISTGSVTDNRPESATACDSGMSDGDVSHSATDVNHNVEVSVSVACLVGQLVDATVSLMDATAQAEREEEELVALAGRMDHDVKDVEKDGNTRRELEERVELSGGIDHDVKDVKEDGTNQREELVALSGRIDHDVKDVENDGTTRREEEELVALSERNDHDVKDVEKDGTTRQEQEQLVAVFGDTDHNLEDTKEDTTAQLKREEEEEVVAVSGKISHDLKDAEKEAGRVFGQAGKSGDECPMAAKTSANLADVIFDGLLKEEELLQDVRRADAKHSRAGEMGETPASLAGDIVGLHEDKQQLQISGLAEKSCVGDKEGETVPCPPGQSADGEGQKAELVEGSSSRTEGSQSDKSVDDDKEQKKVLPNSVDGDTEEKKVLHNSVDGDTEEKVLHNSVDGDTEEENVLNNSADGDTEEKKVLHNSVDGDTEEKKVLHNSVDGDTEEVLHNSGDDDTEEKVLHNSLDGDTEEKKVLHNSVDGDTEDKKVLHNSVDGDTEEKKVLHNSGDDDKEKENTLHKRDDKDEKKLLHTSDDRDKEVKVWDLSVKSDIGEGEEKSARQMKRETNNQDVVDTRGERELQLVASNVPHRAEGQEEGLLQGGAGHCDEGDDNVGDEGGPERADLAALEHRMEKTAPEKQGEETVNHEKQGKESIVH